jgi:hypothetical protein
VVTSEYMKVAMVNCRSGFYDTFIGAATGATRCGSFVGGGFGLLVASYEGIRST